MNFLKIKLRGSAEEKQMTKTATLKSTLLLWFLIFVQFGAVPSAKHQSRLYKKAGVTLYKTCSDTTALVQVDNSKVWDAIAVIKKDKTVKQAAVSIEGTCI